MKRSIGLMVIVAEGANPNGDPDADGRPRLLPDGRGIITPQSIKARWRRLFEKHDSDTFNDIKKELVSSFPDFKQEAHHAWETRLRGFDVSGPGEALEMAKQYAAGKQETLWDRYVDLRLFGGTLIEQTAKGTSKDASSEDSDEDTGVDATKRPKKKEKKEEKKENGDRLSIKRTGVISMSPCISIGPVEISPHTISRTSPLRASNIDKDVGDLAPSAYSFVVCGVYVASITVNPHFRKESRTTDQDIEVFKKTLKRIFEVTTSTARGSCTLWLKNVFWKDHANSLCSFDERAWIDRHTPKRRDGSIGLVKSMEEFVFPAAEGGTSDLVR